MDIGKAPDLRETASAGAWMTVVDLNGEETDFRIHVRGTDSPEFERIVAQADRARKPNKAMSLMEAKRNTLDMLAQMTIGWEGLKDNGRAVPFSQEKAREIYKAHNWLREQVDAFIGDRANFMPKGETNFSSGQDNKDG